MKNILFVSGIRKIISSYKRFISLMLLALLGVGFFVGIKATSPSMLKTLNNYFDKYNVYDIELVSTLGLDNNDIKEIKKLNNINQVVGVKSIDSIVELNKQEKVIKITSLSNINKNKLLKGDMPKNNSEIVVESALLEENDLKIGDTIIIKNNNLSSSSYKIVGTIESPLYFTSYRGTTNIGTGEVNYYTYVLEDTFNIDYYTSIYLTIASDAQTNTTEYKKNIKEVIKELKSIEKIQEDMRFNTLYKEKIDYATSHNLTIDKNMFEKCEWYIFKRDSNQAYKTFIEATDSIKQLGSVFPLVFYVIAILISLISMTRMVEEERTEIGTLKGLGFSNIHIIMKYILYSFLATIIGGILGSIIGITSLPKMVWKMYSGMFFINEFDCSYSAYYITIGILIALLCICGATLITAIYTLKEKPSSLMRPKAPKIGKKIFLEKIPFIWNKLKFSNKIVIRNIFRYKKRILVTIIGIAGSTSLILVGFGLKDSVNNVVSFNYNNVFIYDEAISLKSNTNSDELTEMLNNNKKIKYQVPVSYETLNLYNNNDKGLEVNLISPENSNDLTHVIKLNDINNNYKEIKLRDNGIVLSEKLAKTLNVNVGDKVHFIVDDKKINIKVNYIVENYIDDYAYISKNTYEKIFNDYSINTIYLKTTKKYNEKYNNVILSSSVVSNIVSKKTIVTMMSDVLASLNSVVVILITASAILAFVILYNLSTINISERKREISTLKVLGFYDEEVDSYVTRENYFITIIGIILGLIFGLYLSHYIISTCEPQNFMFIRRVEVFSYLVSAIISFIFTIIVNIITHYNLKKINMVESLKSNE